MFDRKEPSLFWARVDIGEPDECWPYEGGISSWGYGNVRFEKKQTTAHRIAWILANGDIPEGLLVCHHCDNPPCCNPNHLFLGTPKDNIHDMIRKGRQVFGATKGKHINVGPNNGRSKLNEDQVREIRKLKPFYSLNQLSTKFGVSCTTIHDIATEKRWKHIMEES